MANKFSVIIPAYNEEKLLENALKSVRAQDLQGIELIVVNNNSTDKTVEIARRYSDIILNYNEMQNASAARNAGALQASGEYFAFLDADSVLSTNALSEAAKSLSRGYAGGTARIVVEHDSLLAKSQPVLLEIWSKIIGPTYTPYVYTTKENFIKSGGWDKEIELGEEFRFLNKIKKYGKIAFNGAASVNTSPRRYLREGYLRTMIKGTLGQMGVNMKWPPVRD